MSVEGRATDGTRGGSVAQPRLFNGSPMLAAFWLFLYTMCLISVVYVFYGGYSINSGTPTLTSTHVFARNDHSKIVYITESQDRVLGYLGMAVSINALIVIVLGFEQPTNPMNTLNCNACGKRRSP